MKKTAILLATMLCTCTIETLNNKNMEVESPEDDSSQNSNEKFWNMLTQIEDRYPGKIKIKISEHLEKNYDAIKLMNYLKAIPNKTFKEGTIAAFIEALMYKCSCENRLQDLFSDPKIYTALHKLANYKQPLFCQNHISALLKNKVSEVIGSAKNTDSLTIKKIDEETLMLKPNNHKPLKISSTEPINAYCCNSNQTHVALITTIGKLVVWDIQSGENARLSRYCDTKFSDINTLWFAKDNQTIVAKDGEDMYWEFGGQLCTEPLIYLTLSLLKKNLADGITVPKTIQFKKNDQAISRKTWIYTTYESMQEHLTKVGYPHKITCTEVGENSVCFKLVWK